MLAIPCRIISASAEEGHSERRATNDHKRDGERLRQRSKPRYLSAGHMIDWSTLAFNGLWILGLALLVATYSYHDWLAAERGRRRREMFRERSFRGPWTTGLFLTCAGCALARIGPWWGRTFWFALAAWFGWRTLDILFLKAR